jgi:uncharacterized protein YdeI (YjbR/CyaY-like superfamily)
MAIAFFESPAGFRAWLDEHHATARELWVGLHKKDTGKASITYPEALDEALCRGWIDGVRKSLNGTSYTVRFTPRKSTSYWSAVNIKRAEALVAERRMKREGLAAFAKRDGAKPARYAFENAPATQGLEASC